MHVGIFHANRGRTSAFLLPSLLGGGFINRSRRCSALCCRFGFNQRRQGFLERLSRLRQYHPILRPLRSSQRRLNSRQIERKQFRVLRLRSLLLVKQSLLTRVSLNQRNLLLTPSRQPQIFQSLLIDRKNSARRPVFRRHVRDGGSIGQRQIL